MLLKQFGLNKSRIPNSATTVLFILFDQLPRKGIEPLSQHLQGCALPLSYPGFLETMELESISSTCKVDILPTKLCPLSFFFRKRRDSNPRGNKPLIFQVLRYKPDSATFPFFLYRNIIHDL